MRHAVLGCLVSFSLISPLIAEEPDSVDFTRDVLPILADRCYACHGADAEAREADLRLDVREDAIDFGAIVAGEPDDSELIARVFTDDEDLIMPPKELKKPLSEEEKETLRRWVAEGATYKSHWAFDAPTKPELPEVSDASWAKNEIDRFVLKQLDDEGLVPAPPADAASLFRRIHLDITGLPPAPKDVQQFIADFDHDPDQAVSQWIDRLMELPAWGEHRARYWLDAARYGDTHGLHFDNYREMWLYRDWVIRSFNNNQTFDQFTIEQLAGDLLENPTTDQLVATGFQRCNITTNEGGTIAEENLANYASDRVQTFGWVYLGLTTNCCQCHDHKFDPLTMRDYYSLAAYFRNTTQGSHDGNSKDGRGPVIRVPTPEDKAILDKLPGQIDAAKGQVAKLRKEAEPGFKAWLSNASVESLQIPVDDLAFHLPLAEGNGKTLVAEVGADAAIELKNEVKWSDDGLIGPSVKIHSGGILTLGDYLNVDRGDSFSVGAWIRADNQRSTGVIARMDVENNFRGWDIFQQGNEIACHLIDSWPDNALKVTTTGKALKVKKWQHVLVTYNGSGKADGIKIYVDGKPQKTRVENKTLKPDATFKSDVPLKLGQRSSGPIFDGGSVQDLRFYSAVLSQQSVGQLAENGNLVKLLSKPADKRSDKDRNVLKNHYLTSNSEAFRTATAKLDELNGRRDEINKRSPVTHVQKEKMDSSAMANILMRGQYDKVGDEVSAGTPEMLHPIAENAPKNRLGLARWVVDPANPLTTRVTVNRFWQEVFGKGIVTTPEDFGVMGASPSHPELLDWLAVDFRENGWDVKRLFKQMMTSATYRQAAINTDAKDAADRDNALLSRGPRFRMDGEMIRDSALSASGLLSEKMYGPGVRPYQPDNIWNIVGLPGGDTRNYKQDTGENLYRRTIYSFWKRMAPPPNMETFNAPSREVCAVSRERTNTPLQALVTLNDPQFVEAARVLAEKAIASDDTFEARVDFAAQRLIGRSFKPIEMAILRASFDELSSVYDADAEAAQKLIAVGATEASKDVAPAELAAWTMLVNQLMNLDENLNK